LCIHAKTQITYTPGVDITPSCGGFKLATLYYSKKRTRTRRRRCRMPSDDGLLMLFEKESGQCRAHPEYDDPGPETAVGEIVQQVRRR
jgi:hypothetical protein